jgi:hypothetical protein
VTRLHAVCCPRVNAGTPPRQSRLQNSEEISKIG